jgi:hypothetical protein
MESTVLDTMPIVCEVTILRVQEDSSGIKAWMAAFLIYLLLCQEVEA